MQTAYPHYICIKNSKIRLEKKYIIAEKNVKAPIVDKSLMILLSAGLITRLAGKYQREINSRHDCTYHDNR